MAKKSYNKSVFINCPIDPDYDPLFRAMVFAVLRCDFHVRCAVEEDDASEIRLTKIMRMIGECRLGIHDLSRVGLDPRHKLPRFNMPFELGLFLAAKHFGTGDQDRKVCLVFERKRHSYEKFLSDIKGQDIVAHGNSARELVHRVRNWLASHSSRKDLKGGHAIYEDFLRFKRWLPGHCRRVKLQEKDLTFGDYWNVVSKWIEDETP